MLLANSWKQYQANFKVSLVFALLLVFVIPFTLFPNIFASSGSIFVDYNLSAVHPFSFLAVAGLAVGFLLFYSLFLSVLIFSVRKTLSKLRLHFYLSEMMQKFTLKIWFFFLIYSFLLFGLALLMLHFQVPVLFINLLLLALSLAVFFVPQSIVVDEEDLLHALTSNLEFIAGNKRATLTIILVGALLLAVLQLIEFAVDQVALVGAFFSLCIMLVFILPFLETMKTYLYMLKFDLIKSQEQAQGEKQGGKRAEPESLAAA